MNAFIDFLTEDTFYDSDDYARTNTYLRFLPKSAESFAKSLGLEVIGESEIGNRSIWFLEVTEDTPEIMELKKSLEPVLLLRYMTQTTIGVLAPLVKLNPRTRMLYYLTQDASENGYLEFEKRGIKLRYVRLSDRLK